MALSPSMRSATLGWCWEAIKDSQRYCGTLARNHSIAVAQGCKRRYSAVAVVLTDGAVRHHMRVSHKSARIWASSVCSVAESGRIIAAPKSISSMSHVYASDRSSQPVAADVGPEGHQQLDLQQLSVAALKARLRVLGLPVSGKKAVLISRLHDHRHADAMHKDKTVAELKQELRALGLPTSGLKDALHERLQIARGVDGQSKSVEILRLESVDTRTNIAPEVLVTESLGEERPVVSAGSIASQASSTVCIDPETQDSTHVVPLSLPKSNKVSCEPPVRGKPVAVEAQAQHLDLRASASATQTDQYALEMSTLSGHITSPRHVLIVMMGIQGSGKSTLCKLLGSIFRGSVWVNQDETGRSGGARHRFLEAVRRSMETVALPGGLPRLLLVDKMNHQQRHRADLAMQVAAAKWREQGGRILLVHFAPPEGHWPMDFIESRIEYRGAAHRSLEPSADLSRILSATVTQAEPLAAGERDYFDSVLTFDIRLGTVEKAVHVAAELFRLGWVGALQWRVAAVASPADLTDTSQMRLRDVPHWVQTLPFRGKSSNRVESWEDLRAVLRCELEQLKKEEEAWRRRVSTTEQSGCQVPVSSAGRL